MLQHLMANFAYLFVLIIFNDDDKQVDQSIYELYLVSEVIYVFCLS